MGSRETAGHAEGEINDAGTTSSLHLCFEDLFFFFFREEHSEDAARKVVKEKVSTNK